MQIRKLAPVLAALLFATACGLRPPGPGPGPGPGPEPTPELVDLGIFVHDARGVDMPLGDVHVTCAQAIPRESNTGSDGTVTPPLRVLRGRQVDCTFEREGWHTQTASALGGVDAELPAWMSQIPPPHPVSANARQGQLRRNGSAFVDDSGFVNPLWAHAGDLFSVYVRDEGRALKELDDVAAAGYQGIRVWLQLGCGPRSPDCVSGDYWRGREVGPGYTVNYWGKLRAFMQAARERGLRLVASQGDIGQIADRRDYMSQIARIDNEVGGAIDVIDCGNEAWQTGEPDPNALARCVGYYREAGGRALLTLTSPPGEDKAEIDRYSIPPAELYDVHTFRDNHLWDKRRHIFSVAYEQRPALGLGINSEPPGNGTFVSASANKHEIDDEGAPMLALAGLLGRMSYVWFSGEGVIIRDGLHVEGGFATTPRAVGWLPKDVMTFGDLFHSGDSFRHLRIVAASGEGRVDCRRGGDRFACTIDGPPGSYAFPVERAFTGRICDPGTGQCEAVTLNAGDRLNVTFTRGRYFDGRVH